MQNGLMITKSGLTVFLICLVKICWSQTNIQLRSSEDHRPLPFASVVNLTTNKMYSSNEYGIVSANWERGDSIFISYVGYKSLRRRIDTSGEQTWFLNPSNTLLEPIKIMTCRNVVTHEYSNLDADSSERKFGGVGWYRSAMNAKVAVMLIPGFENAVLQSFSIWLVRGMGTPKTAMKAPLKFSFYNIDDSSKLPGELITNQQVFYQPKKEGRQSVGIDSLHIRIPKEGIYVCMEYVYDDRYQYPMRRIDKENGIDSTFYAYAGLIDGVFSKDFTLAFYSYKEDNWVFPFHRDKSYVSERHGTIKFSAILATCSELKN